MTNEYPSDLPLDSQLCRDIVKIVRGETDAGAGHITTRMIADHLDIHTQQAHDSMRKPMNLFYLSRLGIDITQATYRSPWRWTWSRNLVREFSDD